MPCEKCEKATADANVQFKRCSRCILFRRVLRDFNYHGPANKTKTVLWNTNGQKLNIDFNRDYIQSLSNKHVNALLEHSDIPFYFDTNKQVIFL